MGGYFFYARNLVCVCVNYVDERHAGGKIFTNYSSDPMDFYDLGALVIDVDAFYDSINFPQASVKLRSFPTKNQTYNPWSEVIGMSEMKDINISEHRGQIATFLVQVQYRQNATWQGSLMWVEKNQKRNFRSALELIKLMDDTLREGYDVSVSVEQGELVEN